MRLIFSQNLDFGSFIADDSRHRGESGELVSGHFGVHSSQVTQQGGLTHRGEAHEADTCVACLRDIET